MFGFLKPPSGAPGFKVARAKVAVPWIGEIELEVDGAQREVAYKLYVQLSTRIATEAMADDLGSDREALTSIYRLFDITRTILFDAGPGAGITEDTVGGIAIEVLNVGLRPFTSKWHARLTAHENQRPAHLSAPEWEREWADHLEFRAAMTDLQKKMRIYTDQLAEIVQAGRR